MSDLSFQADPNQEGARPAAQSDRRRFLRQFGTGAVAAVGGYSLLRHAEAAPGEAAGSSAYSGRLPTVKIGKYELTRLIAGSNPVSGYAHSTRNLSNHMREYFTLERTVEFVSRCEEMGINAWQSGHGPSKKVLRALEIVRERGSRMHWFCLAWDSPAMSPAKILAHKPIAIVHHGGVTDRLFRNNQAETVHDYVKKVHDAGVLAGVSAHDPAHIAYMEEKGWENDFFMTCFYQVTRRPEEIREKLGTVPLGGFFLESDPDEMTAVIQQVQRPCLAFKILAAGRLCSSPHPVEAAFKYAFSRIKKTDGVIVGMYPKFSDEIAHNVQLTLKYGQTS